MSNILTDNLKYIVFKTPKLNVYFKQIAKTIDISICTILFLLICHVFIVPYIWCPDAVCNVYNPRVRVVLNILSRAEGE